MSGDAADETTAEAAPPPKPKRPSSRARRRMAVVGLILGAAIVALGLPRTVAAWRAMGAEPALSALAARRTPSAAELAAGEAALRGALAWNESGRRRGDLALLLMARAESRGADTAARRADLDEAEALLLAALPLSPGNGYGWFRLAAVREARDGPGRAVAAALAMSLDVAPNARRMWLPRLEMILRNWRHFRPDELAVARRQIRTVWRGTPWPGEEVLPAIDRNDGRVLALWSLADDPEATAAFVRLANEKDKAAAPR
ncbi:MAG: hypothetical protein IPK81_08260 [Rhodospirillales bacterium]|nr:MAG: hypothetical protein IPK81_08260 [Rhodospirillales bacterium]